MFLKCKNKQILIHDGFIVVLVRLKIKKGLIGGGGRLESLLCMGKKDRLSYSYYIDLFYCRR
jgi:hypothetical protein